MWWIGLLALVVALLAWYIFSLSTVPTLNLSTDSGDTLNKHQKIDAWLTKIHEQNKFNGGVLIAKSGKVELMKTYGFADVDKTIPLTQDTPFRLASVSKQFTAVGVMLLKENGQIDYEDLVVKHLPTFPYKTVTIRHLLNHTSGLPEYFSLVKKHKKLSNAGLVELLAENTPPQSFTENTQFQYTNTNYAVLARLIEVVSQKPFHEYMQSEVFTPLGMTHSFVWHLNTDNHSEQIVKSRAEDLENNFGEISRVSPPAFDGLAGDGAVFSSLSDFLVWHRFWQNMDKGDLLTQSTLSDAFKKPTLDDGTQSQYGFGWLITPNGVWHNGSWLGARTFIYQNTEKGDLLVILDNSSSLITDKMANSLIKAMF